MHLITLLLRRYRKYPLQDCFKNLNVTLIVSYLVSKLDYVMLPPISLLETDEKLTFDIGVQLKFGN